MSFNFALLLVGVTALAGIIWLLDSLFWRKPRLARAEAEGAEPVEPWPVDYARSLFPLLLVILLLRSFVAEPFRIPSNSMMPTLLTGDLILVNKFAYGLRLPVLHTKVVSLGEPERGDVAVFRYPLQPQLDYIKRVVGLPGDRITYRDRVIYVNGEPVLQQPLGPYIGSGSGRAMTGALTVRESLGEAGFSTLVRPNAGYPVAGEWDVPEGHYFVMGDNRDNSADSREWGFVPEQNLVGRAMVVWMHWDTGGGGLDISRIGTRIR